jgi:uncharacterized protein involved in exopolysaccharide biosynthesis
MKEQTQLVYPPSSRPQRSGVRDVIAVPFRHRRLVITTFLAVIVGLSLAALLWPEKYQSELKILVKRDRVNDVVSSGTDQPMRVAPLTDQEVNSEVDLLSSQELRQKVVTTLELHKERPTTWWNRWKEQTFPLTEQERVARATVALDQNLNIDPPNRSNLIRITYASSDPQLSAAVLNTLGALYLQKHLEVHRQPGSVEFFKAETERHRQDLERARLRLSEFNRQGAVVSPQLEKDNVLLKAAEFAGAQQETAAAIAASEQRIKELHAQARTVPERTVKEIRTPATLLASLNTTLYELELKRTQLLQKFAPTYRQVREVDEQIAATRSSISAVKKDPLREETTDANPIYAWVTSELAKERAQLQALRARQASIRRTVSTYRDEAQVLDEKGLQQQSLLQAVKVAEESHLLSLKKQEESRVAEELDKQRIANVAIAQAAIIPALPASSTGLRLMLAFLIASILSVGVAFVSDLFDPSFRTPQEAEATLKLPVLAVLPKQEASDRPIDAARNLWGGRL